jgi:hypothetical protein
MSWRLLGVGALIWLVLAGLALWFLGVWPRSAIAWLLVLGLGPVLFLLIDAASELMGNAIGALPGVRQANAAIERRTAHQHVSISRIVYHLARVLLILIPVVLAFWWLEEKASMTAPAALTEWWGRHFN